MDEPVRPDDSECCGSGCKPCIFDVYEERLKKWKNKNADSVTSKGLDQIKYLPFVITNIESLTGCLKILSFQAVILRNKKYNAPFIESAEKNIDYDLLDDGLHIKSGEYLIMKGIYNSIIISRPYTPILNKDNFENGIFEIIVSLKSDGQMSQFFTVLKTNDIVFWRGPYQEFTYASNSFRNILLIGGGTGIVPLYNISKSIVENDKDDTLVNVLASFKTLENLILREEFKSLRDFWNFKMTIYISNQEIHDFQPKYNESFQFKRIDNDDIINELKNIEDDVLVVVCGPDLFNKFVKSVLLKCGFKEENIFIFW